MADENEVASAEVAERATARQLAELVRERCRRQGKLTPLSWVEADGAPLTSEQRETLAVQIESDEECRDIRVMRGASGQLYLYSASEMSHSYARILLRVEEGNPYEQIAATVREESQIYPRPTPLETLRHPAFGLNPDRVEQIAAEMMQLEQYADIRLIRASTGALYLYSDRHLDDDWARSLVEWEEVGRYQSL